MIEQGHLTEKEIKDLFKNKISPLWNKVVYTIDNCSMSNYATELLKICKEESKEHDNFRGDSIKRGITINEEAKLFSLLWICRFLYNNRKKPDAKTYISTKKSVFYAYSIAKTESKRLKKILKKDVCEEIANIDYCKLI